MTLSSKFDRLIGHLKAGHDLSADSASDFVDFLSEPTSSEVEMAALTAAWKAKGEKANEIASIAEYVLSKLKRVSLPFATLDCCGTGGDNSNTFNISTSSAFLAAAAGLKVAKHGGRRTTSASGSIDFLEALQVPTFTEADQIKTALENIGLSFIASPALHGILGRWKAVCRKLEFGGQTGLIGTLTNPVMLSHQLIGVPKEAWGELMLEAMQLLGRKKAMVVFGQPKLDEASLCGTTQVWQLQEGKVKQYKIDPQELGLHKPYSLSDIRGGSPQENAQIFFDLLNGACSKPILQTVLLNTALILQLAGRVDSLQEGMQKTEKIISSGKALNYWKNFIGFSQTLAEKR